MKAIVSKKFGELKQRVSNVLAFLSLNEKKKEGKLVVTWGNLD